MGIQALGHDFHLHGGEEMICHRCDFVIWVSPTPDQAACAVQMLGGGQCPASGIEARSDATTKIGAAEGESPTAESRDAQEESGQ